ncbi:Sialic acid TRAP transporter permease protein SiaT (plasmid) [Sulfitobacter sp. THAF37]|uniref:TRAP transporter large permease n=1 Tax=Sulfitobacter sp. THAF37 TaxID=2587855 RepID=UPI0012697EB9|nr:TRAP transporter large permease [Sulfitobacter sp. THAF37]QFT60874.1 Sialic acid TRAP transporter permease protein SiaT [Sulfitobacter sp. THAF37]
MTPLAIGSISLGLVVVLIALRIPIAMALLGVSVGGIWMILGERPALGVLTTVPYHFAANWTLSSVPMFLFMGYVAFHSGLTSNLFRAARAWLSWLPGGLAIASIFGSGGFASVTGSSVACAAAMGRIAVPEMHKSGYNLGMATGAIAAGGTLGALIPPSILLILYGIQSQVSITALFLGGLLLGGVTIAAYVLVILIAAWTRPDMFPRAPAVEKGERLRSLIDIWPTLLLVFLIFGGLFSGVFTATEAGATGAMLTVALGFARRSLSIDALKQSLLDTVLSSASVFIIAVAANAFTRLIALSGLSMALGGWIGDLGVSAFVLLLVISLVYVFLGMFLEPIGAMLLTLPLVLPLLGAQGIEFLWFGILLAKLLEIGMITPPVGLNIFVIHSVVRDSVRLETIFYGAAAFVAADVVLVVAMILTRGWF